MHRARPIRLRITAGRVGAALGALAGLGTLVAGLPSAQAAAAQPSAQAEYQAAMQTVGSLGVHFSSSASQKGVNILVSGDTGSTSGAEKIVVHRGDVTEVMHAMVVGSTDYLEGNKPALSEVLGLTSAQSSKYASTWLSFPTSVSGLSGLVGGLLDSQVRSEVELNGPYRYASPTTVGGQPALSIKGSVRSEDGGSVPVVLYVPRSGTPYPIEEVTNPGNSGGADAIHGTVSFSDWGEQKSQQAPAHSVSLLTILPKSAGSGTSSGQG